MVVFVPKPLCFWGLLCDTPDENENPYEENLKKQSRTNGLCPEVVTMFALGPERGNCLGLGPVWLTVLDFEPKAGDIPTSLRKIGTERGGAKVKHRISGA